MITAAPGWATAAVKLESSQLLTQKGRVILLHPLIFKKTVENALQEDLASGDRTTDGVFYLEESWAEGVIKAREAGILAGMPVAMEVFFQLDSRTEVTAEVAEGEAFSAGQALARIQGFTRSILSGERVALNFLQRLSGTATATREAVRAVEGTSTRITDTRKTTPGLRSLEKYAVRMGGGENHRMNLSDMVLIKDNHIQGAGSIPKAIKKVRLNCGFPIKVEVEARSLEDVREALECGADVIMLDNMGIQEMREAVNFINGKCLTEASGGISREILREVALTGVDLISLGYLTHGSRALDLALDLSR